MLPRHADICLRRRRETKLQASAGKALPSGEE